MPYKSPKQIAEEQRYKELVGSFIAALQKSSKHRKEIQSLPTTQRETAIKMIFAQLTKLVGENNLHLSDQDAWDILGYVKTNTWPTVIPLDDLFHDS